MPHNIDSMAYYGETPWHGLGKAIRSRATAREMIVAAGLDWKVELQPVASVNPLRAGSPLKCQLIRKSRGPQEPEVPLAVVTSRYRPLQNSEAFEFFDPIVGASTAVFETAGSLGNGERIWALARVPGEVQIVGDDCCSRYLLLSNSHDGRGTVKVKFTPIRVVCQNTLILALSSGEKAYSVRHSQNMHDRLQEVQVLLATIGQTFSAAQTLFQSLAKVDIGVARLEKYLDAVYPRKQTERDNNVKPERWLRVTELFEVGAGEKLPRSHTLWGAYNAVTFYEDYRPAKEADSDRRLNRVWFGAGADLKLHALQQAEALRNQWTI